MANQNFLSLQAVLVGAVADLHGSRGFAQAELYIDTLTAITIIHGESPANYLSSASFTCKWALNLNYCFADCHGALLAEHLDGGEICPHFHAVRTLLDALETYASTDLVIRARGSNPLRLMYTTVELYDLSGRVCSLGDDDSDVATLLGGPAHGPGDYRADQQDQKKVVGQTPGRPCALD